MKARTADAPRVQNLDRAWKFGLGNIDPHSAILGRDDDITVNLPHDYMIAGEVTPDAPAGCASGFYTAGVARYLKTVHIPAEWEGERIYLKFDGVMMNAVVSVNGCRAALHHYGYTPFCTDITPYLYCGQDNRILVMVNPSMQPNSRWYSGAGIFRSVELIHVPPVHIENDGIYVRTDRIAYSEAGAPETAFLQAEAAVRNTTGSDRLASVQISLIDDDTKEAVLTRRAKIQIDAGSVQTAHIAMTVKEPRLWSADAPSLYTVKVSVTDLGVFKTHFTENAVKTVDEDSVLFGIRTVNADAVSGLTVNGRSVKLKGGCVHHDNGLLGAVSLYDAEVRRIRRMKEVGFNAVRTTHNPPSRELLEVCDRLGMYVFAEAFDAWGIGKQPGDYSQFFDTDWQDDLTAFIRRDRNHPSIVIWSTGNEISERGGLNHGYTLATALAMKIKSLDASRPVSNAVCSFWSALDDYLMLDNMRRSADAAEQNEDAAKEDTSWEEMSEPFTNGLDIVGYNYMEDKYPLDHELYPDRVILGSENFPKEIGKRWPMVESAPWIIGDFTWTAVDYIGEAGIGKSFFLTQEELAQGGSSLVYASHNSAFPYRLANDADIDINGHILPQGRYRSVVFGSESTFLFSYVPADFGKTEILTRWGFTACQQNWSWKGDEGRPVSVVVFSRAPEVELFLNGVSLGRKKQGESPAAEELPLSFVFDLTYEPGELTAVSLRDGAEISRDTLRTAGEPRALRLAADRTQMPADGHSLIYVEVEVTDGNGNVVPNAALPLTASAEGAAVLAGFGSANPITTENYVSGSFTSYRGRACAVLRSGYEPGDVVLRVESEALGQAEMTFTVSGTA